ncbi:unnamed protein product [Penicillium camemberti]|uniref:Str. FM013 n=1 Tax=Penicillium camemberti (strain FM 013) TaxID=1429867 RepID=A0A0G4PSD9_PENC3|nr:unnamed protein product [Penicillium camemberti]
MILFPCLVWAALALFVNGQQFDGYEMPYDDLGLSDACFNAVNTTVSSCPAWVARYTGIEDSSFDIVPSEQLVVLCESTCRSDLASLRQAIQTACTEATDVMIPGGSIAYPATFMTDRYLYSTSLSCLTDPSTNEYCDEIVAGWVSNGSEYTSAQNCSPCELGLQKLQLESPFGYSDESAEAFSSLISSCSATGYTFATPTTSPTGTAIASEGSNATTAVAVPTDAQSLSNTNCAEWHELRAADKSAFNCTMFLSLFNVSVTTVTSLNPWIGSDCDTGVWDALSSDGFEQICVEGNSSAVPTSTISTILEPTSTIATTATPPEEVMPDEASTCNKWHTVMSGDDYQAPLLIGMTSC